MRYYVCKQSCHQPMNDFTQSIPGPRKETLDFLKKFARLYTPSFEGEEPTQNMPRNYTADTPASC